MHNNIMETGSRDRPPMLTTGRYAQWRSRFLRYIDTRPNGDALRKCIFKGPYTPTIVTTPVVPAIEDTPPVPEETTVETVMNMTHENRAHFESEKEAIHLILTGIGDEIYSTVDACQTAQEMWEAIERLQQGESLNIQDVKTNLFWEFGQFTSHDGETIESYYTRFYNMMNEMIRNNLTVAKVKIAEAKGPVFDQFEKVTSNPKPALWFPMRLTGLYLSSGWSLGVVSLYTLLGDVSRRSGRRRSFQRLGPCLTSGRTWIPPAGQTSTKASTCTCKKPTIPTRLLSKPKALDGRPHHGNYNLARAAQNWLNRQKSRRSYLDRDPGRGLAFEMGWPQTLRKATQSTRIWFKEIESGGASGM
ncbi:hypothetical protein Tco_0013902 [Tanacetum coccineum]